MSEFTIVTNTLRRPLELVEKSIRASLSQGPSIDVVLVDQNADPLVFPTDLAQNPRFLHQKTPVPSVSMARNRARLPGDCQWIIFCDDDGYLEAGYLDRLKARIAGSPEVPIFAGGIRRTDTGEFYSKRHALGGDMRFFWNTKLLMGSNFCVNRRVFERLGKFDEEFGAGAPFGSSEETDFAWKAFFGREPMVFAPELVVFHVPPFAGEDRFERAKAYRYGYGKGRLVRKWLRKGHPVVLVEFFEMLVVPLLKMLPAVLRAGTRDLAIQGAALLGRIRGFLALEKEAS